ncbi:hypothetical protein CRUP_024133 [Coryphaenoides rupestris]|nr:hypothetical protein CRUP_024133 [Coryphaenoides rupestris]
MWEHRQPDVPAFSALIKPVRNIVTAKRNSPVNHQCSPPGSGNPSPMGFQVVCEAVQSDSSSPGGGVQSCRRGNSVEKGGGALHQPGEVRGSTKKNALVPTAEARCAGASLCQRRARRARYATYFDVAVLRCLLQPHWTEEGDMTLKANEEGKSLSSETFSKVSLTNLRRQAFKNRREDRERKGSIPFHQAGKKRQRRMGVPFLLHDDHLDVSPTRSAFSFSSFSGLGDDRRTLDRSGWQATIMGRFARRGSTDTAADADSLSAKHSHSHHSLLRDLPDHPNSHSDSTVREVRSQISTITMAAFNTTVASFNVGYADFFTEHMKKLCTPAAAHDIMPSEPLACANLPRSLTDSCINYSCLEDGESIEGTNNFILKNGMLDLTLSVVPGAGGVRKTSKPEDKENLEARVKEGTGAQAGGGGGGEGGGGTGGGGGGGGGGEGGGGGGGGGGDGGGESGGGSGKGSKDDLKNNKDNDGKEEGSKLSSHRLALSMLIKIAQNCLTSLYKLNKLQFRQTMREYVNKDSLNNIVDFLHALLGFCMEPVTDNKAGFGNNFTTGDSKSLVQSMEAVVVGCMFKSLITRCASTTHELHSSENLGLYCDIRQLVQFIKESHGNVFRRVALSALLDSAEKVTTTKKPDEREETKMPGPRRSEAGEKGPVSSAADECHSYISSRHPQTPEHEEQLPGALLGRKDFWRKMFKSQSAASDTSSQSEQDTSECTTAHSGTTTDRRSRSRSRRISLRKKLKLPIGNWLKRSSLSGLTDGVEDLLDISSVKFTSAVKLSEGAAGADEEENFFKRHHGFQERLAASQESMKNKNVVNLGAIRQGMKRFQFLLNCCEPGTIPDASILAAALDLEAPVVARASLFLECARFVHRCNRGNWPEWMKGHHVNITKRGLSRGRSPVVGNKRNQKLQQAIGTRLSELCHGDSESPANILGYVYDEESKRRMKKEDEEEDFLDDNTVNPTKCGCPFALKMAACQLLLEITTFLRETFPCLPRPRTEPLVDLDSCRLRLDPELGRHRYERKISFAGILDDEDGRDSLNSSSHTLKSDTTGDEKRSRSPRANICINIRLSFFDFNRNRCSYKPAVPSSPWDSWDLFSSPVVSDLSVIPAKLIFLSYRWRPSSGSRRRRQLSRGSVRGRGRQGKVSLRKVVISRRSWQAAILSPVRRIRIGGTRLLQIKGARSFRVKKGGSLSSIRRAGSLKSTKMSRQDSESENEDGLLPFSTSEPSIEPEGPGSGGAEDNYHRTCPGSTYHHSRSCARLVRAIKLLYGDTVDSLRGEENAASSGHPGARAKKSKECSDKSCLRTPSMKRRPTELAAEGKKDTGMLKYIRNQVLSLSPAPLSLLIKAAPILTDDIRHVPAVPDVVTEMMMAEFHHQEACQRINSVLKFYTLWRFRYQIPPPSINFTLPSPILGMPCVPMFDPPWVPQNTGNVQDPINEDQSKSFSARAVSRSHQRAEHILKNLQQEEERRRLGREASIISAIPVMQEACYEPTCSPPPEQEEEAPPTATTPLDGALCGPYALWSALKYICVINKRVIDYYWITDEENTTEHTPTHHMLQPPQAVFPACICAAVLPIVHLMEDGEVREDGVAVSAVAQQILWNCLIEDPALVLRHFLEKLTVSNRQRRRRRRHREPRAQGDTRRDGVVLDLEVRGLRLSLGPPATSSDGKVTGKRPRLSNDS